MTLNSFGMFSHGGMFFHITVQGGKFACIREQFSINGLLKFVFECDLATSCDCVFFLQRNLRIHFANLSCTQQKQLAPHAGPRKMDLQMDQKVRTFVEDFVT